MQLKEALQYHFNKLWMNLIQALEKSAKHDVRKSILRAGRVENIFRNTQNKRYYMTLGIKYYVISNG
jgi:hypothetical protein